MHLHLHKHARTTPAIRQERRASTLSERELARKYHLNRATVRQWRRRDTGQDAAHRPHRLHTTLTPRPRARGYRVAQNPAPAPG